MRVSHENRGVASVLVAHTSIKKIPAYFWKIHEGVRYVFVREKDSAAIMNLCKDQAFVVSVSRVRSLNTAFVCRYLSSLGFTKARFDGSKDAVSLNLKMSYTNNYGKS